MTNSQPAPRGSALIARAGLVRLLSGVNQDLPPQDQQAYKALSVTPRWIQTALDEARGMVKAVVDGQTDLILGCAVLGIQGGEIMSAMQMAMMGGLTASQLREAVFAHPTLAEGLNNLFAP